MSVPETLQTKGILVVDDQKFIRAMVAQSLKRFGFLTVAESVDGFDAARMLGGGGDASGFARLLARRPDIARDVVSNRQTIDCVVTDIRMSPMNGLELLKAIRSGVAGHRRDLPVVVMSAHSDENLIAAAIALDANAFVVKPASQATLSEKVMRALTTDLKVQPGDFYAALSVPEVDDRNTQLDASSAAPKSQTIRASDLAANRVRPTIRLPIVSLAVNDVLTEGVTALSGAVIVPQGTKVTPALIHALGDLAALVQLPPEVTVQRPER